MVTMVGVMKPRVSDITHLHSNVAYSLENWDVFIQIQGGGGADSFGRVVYHVQLRGIIVGNILMAHINWMDHSTT